MKRSAIFVLAACWCAMNSVHAEEVEIPGLLTDHTVTSVGHSFYRAFSDKWESSYTCNLTINERPSARWGSWITITAGQDVVYQAFLYPTKRDFDKNVEVALVHTDEALKRRLIDKQLLSTSDLTHDEF